MARTTRLFLVLSFSLVLVSFAPLVQADDPKSSTQESQTQAQEKSVIGDLKSIDSDAKKLVVTTSEGSDMEFMYDDRTEILGAGGTVEGLSAKTGTRVKVFYNEESGQNKATRIKVKDAQKDS
ncbi:MAG: hypothetical protein EHM23_08080 [Acidobacteria bacterium]|nr:MAG: hypothetical protein EHM23_08080 [Acidobacteriota bacterium]